MPQNKKHHFVPKFLLRRFSRDKKSINLYNFKSKKKILGGNLSNQCYSNYLYGEDPEVEKSLSAAEGEIAELLRRIDKYASLPPPGSPEAEIMIFFVLSQRSRTTYAAEELSEQMDAFMKEVFKEKFVEEGLNPDEFLIGVQNPAQWSMGHAVQSYPLLWDMGYKLLVNKTNVEFVISDNPVVFYNQLMSYRTLGSNCGLASKGLEILVPISPQLTIMMYDPIVYRVGSDAKPTIDITNPRDVYELNTLQAVAAQQNIYFSDPNLDVEALHEKAESFFRKQKAKVRTSPEEDVGDGKKSVIIGTSAEDIRTNLSLSFVTVRGAAKEWREKLRKQLMQPAAIIRNKNLMDAYQEFKAAVAKSEYTPQQFAEFFNKNYGEEGEDAEAN